MGENSTSKPPSTERLHLLGRQVSPSPISVHQSFRRPLTRQGAAGTSVSRGMHVSAALSPREVDDMLYPRAAEFDGLRFYKLRMSRGMDGSDRDTFGEVNKLRNLGFGAGHNPCPGRAWAIALCKCALAHLLLQYQILPATAGKPMQHTFGFEDVQMASLTDRIVFLPL